MKKRIVVFLMILPLVAAFGCRSRKQVAPPQAAPVAAAEPAPAEVVPERADFVAPAAETPVRSEDIEEANRLARERGWIRDAFFAYDASTLDAAAQEALDQSATWLRSNPQYALRIEGHCDERGTEQYNLALGDRRAETARQYLETLGISRERISTVSYGEERPFETASNEPAWAANRRAHLVLEKGR